MAKNLPIFGSFINVIQPPNFRFSGWKFHVYSNSEDDVIQILQYAHDYVKENACAMKAATPAFFSTASPIQKGKGITIYLPFDMIKSNRTAGFFNGLIDLLNKIPNHLQARASHGAEAGIIGDNSVSNSRRVFYRYELNIPFEEVAKRGGLSQSEYNACYSANEGGSYLGKAGVDLFQIRI